MKTEIFENLRKARDAKNLIIFCGAGLSMNLKRTNETNYPSWKKLIKELIETQGIGNEILEAPEKADMISYLDSNNFEYTKVLGFLNKIKEIKSAGKIIQDNTQLIKEELPNIFERVNVNLYNNKDILDNFHSKLLKISENKVITTNYDDAFEKVEPSLKSKKFVCGSLNIDKLASSSEFLFKLHGDISIPQSCVLFESDYDYLYSNYLNMPTTESLKALFLSKTFLFVGFSLSDFEIAKIIKHLQSLGKSLQDRLYFIATDEPQVSTFEFYNNTLFIDKEGDRTENYKRTIEDLFQYCNKDQTTKSQGALTSLKERSEGLLSGEYQIKFLMNDIEGYLSDSDTKSIFSTDTDHANIILKNFMEYLIKVRFVEKNEAEFEQYFPKIYEYFKQLDLYKLELSFFNLLKQFNQNTSPIDNRYKYYNSILESINLMIENLEYIDESYRNIILESNVIQQNYRSELVKVRKELVEEYTKKEQSINDFFNNLKQNPKHFINLKREDIQRNIHLKENEKRFDILMSDLKVYRYLILKSANLIDSSKHRPNIRFSLIFKDENMIGYIDKNLALVTYRASEDTKILSDSLLIRSVKIKSTRNTSLIDLVSFFAHEVMIDYNSHKDKPINTPSIFVKYGINEFFSYKDVFFYIEKVITKENRNEKFFNRTIAEIFSSEDAIAFSEIPDISKLNVANVDDYSDTNDIGILVKSNKKVSLLNLTSYYFWLRFIPEEKVKDTTPISKIHKELFELLQVLEGTKSTFIVEPSYKYIFDSFDFNDDTIISLVQYFMRPESLEVGLLKIANSDKSEYRYKLISFNMLFEKIRNYFITL